MAVIIIIIIIIVIIIIVIIVVIVIIIIIIVNYCYYLNPIHVGFFPYLEICWYYSITRGQLSKGDDNEMNKRSHYFLSWEWWTQLTQLSIFYYQVELLIMLIKHYYYSKWIINIISKWLQKLLFCYWALKIIHPPFASCRPDEVRVELLNIYFQGNLFRRIHPLFHS